jgi:hypothetical protein
MTCFSGNSEETDLEQNQRSARVGRLALLLALALVSIVLLGYGTGNDARGRLPAIGSRLPNVLPRALMRNAPVNAPPPQKGWIVYVFSPGSAASRRNSGNVEQLAHTMPADWAFLAVATEENGLEEFLKQHRVTVPVLTQVPVGSLAAYGIQSTPRTYILDRDWKLLEVLGGELKGKTASRLAARIGIPLPRSGEGSEGPRPAPNQPDGGSKLRNLCLDGEQRPYSRGAEADALGLKFRCQAGGVWAAAA